jgi:hypothetical protein
MPGIAMLPAKSTAVTAELGQPATVELASQALQRRCYWHWSVTQLRQPSRKDMVQHNCGSRARRSRNTYNCDSRARKDIVMANKTQSRHGAMVCGTAVTAEPEEQNVRAAPEGMYIYTYLRLFSATTLLACTGVELTAWRSPRRLQAVPAGRQGLATFATTLLAGTGVAARRSPRRLQAVPAGM